MVVVVFVIGLDTPGWGLACGGLRGGHMRLARRALCFAAMTVGAIRNIKRRTRKNLGKPIGE